MLLYQICPEFTGSKPNTFPIFENIWKTTENNPNSGVTKQSVLYSLFLSFCLILAVLCQYQNLSASESVEKSKKPVSNVKATFEPINRPDVNIEKISPHLLTANDLSIASGEPSLVIMSNGPTRVPVWSLSGKSVGQSVTGIVPGFPECCSGVKVEIIVTSTDKETSPKFEDVFRVHLSQIGNNVPFNSDYVLGTPVRTSLPEAPFYTRTIVLESYYPILPNLPLAIRIQREPDDPADTFTRPVGLIAVKVSPVGKLIKPELVQNVSGYNSWPVIQSIGKKLVCVYCRGTAHTIDEDLRAVYARTSSDGGKTWTAETVVANTPGYGEVTIGKGLDANGNMLLWVRRIGKEWNQDLYRSADGVNFKLVTTPKLDVMPIQITDVFKVPGVGLMSLWFAGVYNKKDGGHSWGTLTSSDNGATWKQNVIEADLTKEDWPTEPSAVYLGNGRILALARSELGDTTTKRSQFQLTSTDNGKTWKRSKTNIGDVLASTPSLIFDPDSGLLSNYYYHRGRGVLRYRIVDPEKVFNNPLSWPDSQPISLASSSTFDAGNVNVTTIGNTHYAAYYSGKGGDTSILVSPILAPASKKVLSSEKMNVIKSDKKDQKAAPQKQTEKKSSSIK